MKQVDQRLVNEFQWDCIAASIERALSVLFLCWMGPLMYMCVNLHHFAYLLKWPGPVCYPGQANRFWAHADWLSSLWKPARCRGCMWDRERKGTLDEDASSPARETAQDADEHSEKTHNLSRRNDKAHCSGFLWGAVGYRYTNHSFRRSGPHSPFLLVYRKQSLFLLCSPSIFKL